MKKKIFTGFVVLLFLLSGSSIKAIDSDSLLWLVSAYGGANGFGAIATTDMQGNSYNVRHSFTGSNGKTPHGYLLMASDGLFYGTARKGGTSDKGTLYSFDTATNIVVRHHSFNGTSDGGEPQSSLIQAPNGKLYGTAWNGGASSSGTIFELDITQNPPVFTKKIDFDGLNGRGSTNTLFVLCDGRIFGITPVGGPTDGGFGTIYGYDYTTNTIEKLYQFDYATGRNPYGSFIQASDGLLYGMAAAGGNDGNGITTDYGTIFSFNPADSTFNLEYSLNNTIGKTPRSDLMEASNGKLYGMTQLGGTRDDGVIFEFDPTTGNCIKLINFFSEGANQPSSAFFESTNGKLYATTQWGGTGGAGIVFEYDPVSTAFIKKVDFNWVNGGLPQYSKFVNPATQPACCWTPSNLIAVNETTETAELGWTENGSASSWELRLGESGFDTTGLTPVIISDIPPYYVSWLSAGTAYEFYMRSVCSAENKSEWVGPQEFTTYSPLCTFFQVNLHDSNGDPLTGGFLEFREGGGNPWQNANEISAGVFCIETERSKVGLRMAYGPQVQKIGGVSTDADYTFQTVNVTVALEDGGNPLDGGEVDYTAYGYHSFGFTGDNGAGTGTASREMLPAQYTFRMKYMGDKENKTELISNANNLLTFDLADLRSSLVGEDDFQLTAYPNPFSGNTTIAFSLEEAQEVSIAVYDQTGRLIELLHEGYQTEGKHKIFWEGNNLNKGVYLVRLRMKGKTAHKNIVKM